jgi:hypothetical protein
LAKVGCSKISECVHSCDVASVSSPVRTCQYHDAGRCVRPVADTNIRQLAPRREFAFRNYRILSANARASRAKVTIAPRGLWVWWRLDSKQKQPPRICKLRKTQAQESRSLSLLPNATTLTEHGRLMIRPSVLKPSLSSSPPRIRPRVLLPFRKSNGLDERRFRVANCPARTWLTTSKRRNSPRNGESWRC